MKTPRYDRLRRLPERPPRVRILKQEATVRAQNVVRICFHCLFSKKLLGNAAWIGFNCKCFKKMFERMKRIDSKSTLLMIWHALGKGLANSNYSKEVIFLTSRCLLCAQQHHRKPLRTTAPNLVGSLATNFCGRLEEAQFWGNMTRWWRFGCFLGPVAVTKQYGGALQHATNATSNMQE